MTMPLRLLIVEDNPSDAELMLIALRHAGYEPSAVRVDCEEEFLDHLEPTPNVILSDFSLPNFDPMRALEIIQQRRMEVPFIVVSGTIGEERAVQVMQRGATDFVIKDRLGRLGSAVKQALERQRLKDAQLKTEQMVARLATIVETSSDAIIAASLDGVITCWNFAAEKLFGYSAEEMLGKDFALLNPHNRRQKDKPEDFRGILGSVRTGEHIAAFETVRVRKNGRRIEVLLSISPIRDGHGAVTGASAIAIDITLRKRTERFLAAKQSVTGILTESKTLQEAGPRVLQSIAECLRWEVAVLWTIDRSANVLRRMHSWHSSWADARFINALGQGSALEPGMGVAGRAWSTGHPVWERDIGGDNQPIEHPELAREGVRCGFGLPMRHGSEMVGVIEFYNSELRELEAPLLALLDEIACQVSQFCEWRRTEDALRASEEQFRQLADAMPQLVWTARSDGAVDYFNARWYDLTGSARDADPELIWRAAVDPDDLERTQNEWEKSVRTGDPHELEARIVEGTTGRSRWHLFRAVAVRDAAGVITRWYGTGTDIDDRKRSHDELLVGEERLRTLVMALPAAVYTTDRAGMITLFNEHAAALWGRRPELGKDRWCGAWRILQLDGTPLPPDQHPMAVALREGVAVRGKELIVERPDGSRSYVLKHPELLRGKNGEITGAVNMVVDITQMKQLEEQYRHSQKMEAVGQLAAGVAHDFNNLLTIVLGYSDLLLSKMSEVDPSRDKLTQIRKAGESAAALTRQLLAFGHKQILAPVVLDLNTLLGELERMLRRLFGTDIEMVTIPQVDLGWVKVDPGQVEQVIINLVVNARDAMPKGGLLTIRTGDIILSESQARQHPELLPGSYAMLSVSDSGVGMNEATKAHIFEPFFTTKEVGKGTGLGLSTVFGIVKQSGGFIEIDSAVNSGSTFRIFFPQVRGTLRRTEPSHRPIDLPGGTETILLVDDNDDLRELAKLVLQTGGYKVLIARNGGDAVRIGYEYKDAIHLLLTDVVMPNMSGRQLTDLLQPSRPDMQVLFMSGYTDDTMVRHGIADAESHFLAKPFTPTALAQKVRDVLDGISKFQRQPSANGRQSKVLPNEAFRELENENAVARIDT